MDAFGKFPFESGGSYAITVYTLRIKGTPSTTSAICAKFDVGGYDWIMPIHMLFDEPEENVLLVTDDVDDDNEPENDCPENVRSRGCRGISVRESKVTLMLMGVVHGTQSVQEEQVTVSPLQ